VLRDTTKQEKRKEQRKKKKKEKEIIHRDVCTLCPDFPMETFYKTAAQYHNLNMDDLTVLFRVLQLHLSSCVSMCVDMYL
jgi:hypothetical protein